MIGYILLPLVCALVIYPGFVEMQRRNFRPSGERSCDLPRLTNGIVRMRQRGRLVQFSCVRGYMLIGEKYSACLGGRWDSATPICIKNGCSPVAEPLHAVLYPQYNYSIISLFCHTGFQRNGPQRIYCNGTHWDQPLGECQEISIEPARLCDFEHEDWCGWSQDATNDYLWKRSNGISKGWSIAIGPSHDHTTGVPLTGFYVYLDMSEAMSGQLARLVSPSYPANYSKEACFKIFYHMFGISPGTLRLFTKPVGIELEDALANSSYKAYEVTGNKGNKWNELIVPLPQYPEDFQVVIEGESTLSFASHIAIDDVALMNGSQCAEHLENNSEEVGGVWVVESCLDRCSETNTTLGETKISIGSDGKITKKCDCFFDCETINTCCPDYGAICSTATSVSEEPVSEASDDYNEENSQLLTSTIDTSIIHTSASTSTTEGSKSTTLTSTSIKIPTSTSTSTIVSTTSSTPIITTSKVTLPPSSTRTPQSTTKSSSKQPSTSISTTVTTVRTLTTKPMKPSTIKPVVTTTKRQTTKKSIPSTFLFSTKQFSSTKTTAKWSTTKRISSSSRAPNDMEILPTHDDYDDEDEDEEEKNVTFHRQLPARKINHNVILPPEKPHSNILTQSISLGLIIFAVLVAATAVVGYVRRRRNDPRNYKQNVAGGFENVTDEFSEVRYLTSDEILDFTPQTPALDRPKSNSNEN